MPKFHGSNVPEEDLTPLSREEFKAALEKQHEGEEHADAYIKALLELSDDGELIPYTGTDGNLYLEPVVKVSQTPAEA
jgi:hypothetical protein